MAGGWARDDAVNEQIEISTAEAVARARLRARGGQAVPSALVCEDCDEPIPDARRVAIPGVQLCVACQAERDGARRSASGGMNRRASKDALLK